MADNITLALLTVAVAILLAILFRVEGLAQKVEAVAEEARYDIPPERQQTIQQAIVAIKSGDQQGVAFFISPSLVLTAAHVLTKGAKKVTGVRPSDEAQLTFDVIHRTNDLDFAILRLRDGQPRSEHRLKMVDHVNVRPGEKGLFLVACNSTLAGQAPDVTDVGITWRHARVVRMHDHHFLYDAASFDGDSGGAIVIARTGEVVGLHQELVNQANEEITRSQDLEHRLTAVQKSVKSLIRGSSSGCIALRIDAGALREAVRSA